MPARALVYVVFMVALACPARAPAAPDSSVDAAVPADGGASDAEALSEAEAAVLAALRAGYAALEAGDPERAAPHLVVGVDGLVAHDADLAEWAEVVVIAAYAAIATRPLADAARMLALTARLPGAALDGEAADLVDAAMLRAKAGADDGDRDGALALLDAAVAGPGAALAPSGTFELRALRGGLLLVMDHPAAAADALTAALAAQPADVDPLIASVAHRNRGQALAAIGELDAAADALIESAALARAPDVDPRLLAEALHIGGDLLERADRPDAARRAYADARERYAELLGDAHPDALYAGCHRELLTVDPPLDCARLADVRAALLGRHPATAEALVLLARAQQDRGDAGDALAAFDAAVALQSTLPVDPDDLATTLRRRAGLRLALADEAGAQADIEWGLAIVDALGGADDRAMWLHDLAAVATQRDDEAAAARWLAQAGDAALGPFERAALVFARAIIDDDAGRADAAAPRYAEGLALIGDQPPSGHGAWWRIRAAGNALRRGEADAARALAHRALAEVEQSATPYRARVLSHYALLAYAREDDTAAIFQAKRAVEALEATRGGLADAERFVDGYADEYGLLADYLVERRGRLAEADAVLGLLGPRALADRARGAAPAEPPAMPRTPTELGWLARYDAAVDRLRVDGDTPAFIAALDALEGEMRAAQDAGNRGDDFDLTGIMEGVQPQLAALDAARGGKAALVQLFISTDGIIMLATTADEHRFVMSTMGGDELNTRAAALARALSGRGAWRALAEGLYTDLIAPLRDALDGTGVDALLWSLDGALRYVPMAALVDPATGRFLVEDYALARYAPPVGDAPRRPLDRIAAFGASRAVPEAGLSALPSVRLELATVVRPDDSPGNGVIAGAAHLDDDFTAARFLAALAEREAPIVHVASHFVFRPGPASASFLALGDGGRLGLDRLADVRFDGVELLTLSACQTAVGTFAEGQPLDGFAALALQRGARRVVASLWPVPDDSTALLMARFYTRLAAGDAPIDALRAAQLAMLGSRAAGPDRLVTLPGRPAAAAAAAGPHPYAWAPFVLIGDPR